MRALSAGCAFLLIAVVLLTGCDTEFIYEYSGTIKHMEYQEVLRIEGNGYQKVNLTFEDGPVLQALIAENDLKTFVELKEGRWYKIVCVEASYQTFRDESYNRKMIVTVETR